MHPEGVFGAEREAAHPLVLGAVKTNVGHTEAAAGMAGFCKIVMALQHRAVPPNLHLQKLNPLLDIADFPVVFPEARVALQGTKALVAGLSSFGFSGTNAHVVLQEAPASGRSDIVRSSARSVAFLFTGQGSQYAGMGKELYESDAAFRAALDRCAALCAELLPTPLLEVMFESDAATLDSTEYAQPAIFAVEYALTEMWRAKGVTPDFVLGHSVGEFAAAVAAGMPSSSSSRSSVTEFIGTRSSSRISVTATARSKGSTSRFPLPA